MFPSYVFNLTITKCRHGLLRQNQKYYVIVLGRANEECNLDPTVHHLKKEDLTPTQVRKLRYQGFCRKTCGLCDDIIFEKETKKEEIKLGKFSPPRPTPSRPRVKNFYRQVMGRSNSQFLSVEYLKCMKGEVFLTNFYFYQFLKVKIIVWLSDPACGPTVTPDCQFLEKSGICISEPMRCIYGCTLCKKPKDLLPLILPQSRDKKLSPKIRNKALDSLTDDLFSDTHTLSLSTLILNSQCVGVTKDVNNKRAHAPFQRKICFLSHKRLKSMNFEQA